METKEEKLTKQVEALKGAVKKFILHSPEFSNSNQIAREIGQALADVECTLHYEFNCWELATPW